MDPLADAYKKCTRFALLCAERVKLLEEYKVEADASLKTANEQVYICRENVEAEKKKRTIIIPVVALLLGGLAGFLIAK